MRSLILFTFVIYFSSAKTTSLEDFNLHPCHTDSPHLDRCIVRNIRKLTPSLLSGAPELGIPKLNPFEIDEIRVNRKISDNIHVRAVLQNVTVDGLSSSVINRVKFSKRDNILSIIFTVLNCTLESDFVVNTNMFPNLLSGQLTANLTDVIVNLRLHLRKYISKGIEYFSAKPFTANLYIGGGFIEGVANPEEDQPFLDMIVDAFNRNPRVADVLAPLYSEVFIDELSPFVRNLFAMHPVEEFLLH